MLDILILNEGGVIPRASSRCGCIRQVVFWFSKLWKPVRCGTGLGASTDPNA